MPITLPSERFLADRHMSVDAPPSTEPEGLDAATALGGDLALAGTLTRSDDDLGWIAEWCLSSRPRPQKWEIRGVSFDAAFRDAMSRTLEQLSSGREAD